MADWHLKELRDALETIGWVIIAEVPGDDYAISATWEIRRSNKQPSVFIDFEGLDDMATLPIERSYGCHVRGRGSCGLYFGRRGEGKSARRRSWANELNQVVEMVGVGSGE
jgi:hypothetical protein